MIISRFGQLGRLGLAPASSAQMSDARVRSLAFGAGEKGGMWFPWVMSSMFQDLACTVPVTSYEQSVWVQRDLSGNGLHKIAPASAKRPKLRALYNNLVGTEDFTTTNWTKQYTTVTKNEADCLGGTRAGLVSETTDNNFHFMYSAGNYAIVTGVSYSNKVVLKKGNGTTAPNIVQLTMAGGGFGGTQYANVNLTTGAVTAVSGSTCTTEDLGGGYWRITYTATATATTSVSLFYVAFTNNNPTATRLPTYAGQTTSNVFVMFPDSRPTSDFIIGVPFYQRVTTPIDYDATGFPPYLQTDAVDDCMQTAAVDFSATNKITVWSGVRCLAGTDSRMFIELSANGYLTTGGVTIGQGTVAVSPGFGFLMNTGSGVGAQTADKVVPYGGLYTVKFDSAQSGLANEAVLAQNGVVQSYASTSGTDSGTGNFANDVLNFYSRNGVQYLWNGRDYGSIIRGAATSDVLMSQINAYLNSKMKLY